MKDKQRYKAQVAGKTYTIVGNRSTQHLDAVVELINGQLEQLSDLAPSLSVEDRSILMAINAVSDQIVKEDRIMELESRLEMAESEINRIRQYQSKTQADNQKNETGNQVVPRQSFNTADSRTLRQKPQNINTKQDNNSVVNPPNELD